MSKIALDQSFEKGESIFPSTFRNPVPFSIGIIIIFILVRRWLFHGHRNHSRDVVAAAPISDVFQLLPRCAEDVQLRRLTWSNRYSHGHRDCLTLLFLQNFNFSGNYIGKYIDLLDIIYLHDSQLVKKSFENLHFQTRLPPLGKKLKGLESALCQLKVILVKSHHVVLML